MKHSLSLFKREIEAAVSYMIVEIRREQKLYSENANQIAFPKHFPLFQTIEKY
jgi:hypothetical protein